MKVYAIDTETELIGPGNVAPKLICASFATFDPEVGENVALLLGNGEAHEIEALLTDLLEDDDAMLVFHNAAFDLTVIANAFPDLIPAIFDKLEKGLCTDTIIREKLLNLSTHGRLENLQLPDGSSDRISYALADLVLNYTGVDRRDEKLGDDIWRLNYDQLDGRKAEDYPAEAIRYAMQDALDTLEIHDLQAERVQGPQGPSSVKTAEFHTAASFALRLMTCWGFAIDQDAVDEVAAMLDHELRPEMLQLLIDAKILSPGLPERPYKNGAIDKATGRPKMKAATKDKISKKLLQAHVEKISQKNGIEPKLTAKGQISTDSEVLKKLAPLDPIIEQYQHRQKLQKLVTTYLPVLQDAEFVHPEFDVLKETGRTSSYASKLYPSCNIQQVDPRVRQCYVPREGQVLCSTDYEGIELASFAQVCYSLFGYSVHRDKINEGTNLHAYLGAQLAFQMDEDFRSECANCGSPEEVLGYFMELKKNDPDFFTKWRNKMAKPTGLGLPGGMGVDTFITLCRGYGLEVDRETATEMKQVWLETYPEAKDYFQAIKTAFRDPHNARINDQGGREQLYAYFSPMGMYRAGATYCAAANGNGLQTPTAEGAKLAVFQLARECYDWTQDSVLYGCRPLAFIHDETIVEIPDDNQKHIRAARISDIMVDCMQRVMPDVVIKAEPALMRRWDKKAEPVFDAEGRLTTWTPKPSKEQDDGRNEEEEEAAA